MNGLIKLSGALVDRVVEGMPDIKNSWVVIIMLLHVKLINRSTGVSPVH